MPSQQRRPKNAAATRQAILDSAIVAFARAGYDGVGVREIAQGAGVTAMLVNRYFGSKRQLFAEAVETSFAAPVFVAEQPRDAATIARDIASELVARIAPDDDLPAPFLIMLRSVSNADATEIVRGAIERHVKTRLVDALPGPSAQPQADLILGVISGALLMQRIVAPHPVDETERRFLRDALEKVFGAIVNTPVPKPKRRRRSVS